MPRKKKTPFAPWESRDPYGIERRYFRMGATFMASKAVRGLSPSAFKILCFMKVESLGHREFEFPHNKFKDYMSKPTFYRVIEELETAGLIDVVARNKNLRIANRYAFSERWKNL